MSARTFRVSDVEPATEPLPEVPYREAVSQFLTCGRLEACARDQGALVADVRAHPLIAALHEAFAEHRPIALSPDIVWLTLMQGVAHHVNTNAERLRKQLVSTEGKPTIEIHRNDFVLGSAENPWPEVFSSFSDVLRDYLGETHALIVADFSTTTAISRAASEVALLDTVQAFFDYEVHTLCGIPTITLEGTVEDWRAILRRVEALRRFDLGFWVDALSPVLERFVAAASGSVDGAFWESIYKWRGPVGSGSAHVNGWILDLFPYLDNPRAKFSAMFGDASDEDDAMREYVAEGLLAPPLIQNPWLGTTGLRRGGPGRDDFPCLPSSAPFKWVHLGRELPMRFVGGLMGVRQDRESLCLRPEIGWAVHEATVGVE